MALWTQEKGPLFSPFRGGKGRGGVDTLQERATLHSHALLGKGEVFILKGGV